MFISCDLLGKSWFPYYKHVLILVFKKGLFTAELDNGVMQPPLRKKFASFVHGKIHVKFKKKIFIELAKGGIKLEIKDSFFSCTHDIIT